MTQSEIEKIDNITEYKKRKTKLDDYINIIYKMVKDDLEYKIIYSYIKYKGYEGNKNTLDSYIYLINKNNFPNNFPKGMKFIKNYVYPKDVIVVKRTSLLKYILIVNPKTKKTKQLKII